MISRRESRVGWLAGLALSVWLLITAPLSHSLIGGLVFACQVALCFLLGYAVLSLWRRELSALEVVLATILGLELITSVYAVGRFLGLEWLHWLFLIVGVAVGSYRLFERFCQRLHHRVADRRRAFDVALDSYALLAGVAVMVTVGSSFYFSGRVYSDGLSFFGPMGRDHAFHLALIARLEHVVPPDNFVISGFPFPSYHFFCDLSPYLFARGLGARHDILDVYYRYYPALVLFLIGFLSFWVPARLFAWRKAGLIGAALVVFGGDFSWILGLIQTAKALPDLTLAQEKLFSSWTSWSAFGTLYPLVHRPSYYHGLLLLFAGLAPIVARGRGASAGGAWLIAGLIWGLMAGYNYTLAVTMGMAIVCSAGITLVRGDRENAWRLATCAAALASASVIANFFVLSQGSILNQGSTSLFFWAPGSFLLSRFGWMFGRAGSGLLPLAGSLAAFALLSYGVRLVGIWSMLRAEGFRFRSNAAVATMMLIAFVICLAMGLLFENRGIVAVSNNIIYLQPTGWMLGLYAAFPLARFVNRRPRLLRTALVTGLLVIGPLQAIPEFNLGYKIVLEPALSSAFQRIRAEAGEGDVIAFWPDSVRGMAVFGRSEDANNFFVSAFTGLPAYFSVRPYSEYFAGGATGIRTYDERVALIRSLMEGKDRENVVKRLRSENVKWILLPSGTAAADGAEVSAWISETDFAVVKVK